MAIELREFAEQVLFGTTMEEKLSFPREEIVDTRPGCSIATPRSLSRPANLVLRENGVKASHPSVAKLVDERERGKLLHFFGNHELLATELMALALLKFPDAPASFRQGLLETLKDEQIHTRMYIHRMKQCGVEFGELPLSDYFWRSVSSMEDPLDYVTRLSLTFEQANLDYSREYGKIFEEVGDSSTANILDKIYRDEIDHVGFGLKWFRRWKAEGKTDWDAYRERLSFPLSPARAKGDVFNAEGRVAVGFDDAFIEDLQIFKQSRGRTPSVFWFNPEAERFAAANQVAGAAVADSVVRRDLGFLPAYLSKRDDILLLEQRPSSEFLRKLLAAGFELPEVMGEDGSKTLRAPAIDRKIGDLRPWAWSPESVEYFASLMPSVTRGAEVGELWNERRRELFAKTWSSAWGRSFTLTCREDSDWLAPEEVYAAKAGCVSELQDLRSAFAANGYGDLALKAPFGTAANGNRCWLAGEALDGQVEAWANAVIAEQGCVLVEPWLERVFDFSVQWERRGGELRVVGFTRLLNNARGQFRGIVTNGFCSGLDAELTPFLMRRVEGQPRIYRFFEQRVAPALEEALAAADFSGALGIDAFVYRDLSGSLRLKPVVELNPRYTMGRVALELGQRNAATAFGFFQIVNRSQIRKSGAASFSEYANRLEADWPVELTDEKKPRIASGTLALTDPSLAKQFLALYHVRKRFGDLPL